jgi:hypothetical protein
MRNPDAVAHESPAVAVVSGEVGHVVRFGVAGGDARENGEAGGDARAHREFDAAGFVVADVGEGRWRWWRCDEAEGVLDPVRIQRKVEPHVLAQVDDPAHLEVVDGFGFQVLPVVAETPTTVLHRRPHAREVEGVGGVGVELVFPEADREPRLAAPLAAEVTAVVVANAEGRLNDPRDRRTGG